MRKSRKIGNNYSKSRSSRSGERNQPRHMPDQHSRSRKQRVDDHRARREYDPPVRGRYGASGGDRISNRSHNEGRTEKAPTECPTETGTPCKNGGYVVYSGPRQAFRAIPTLGNSQGGHGRILRPESVLQRHALKSAGMLDAL